MEKWQVTCPCSTSMSNDFNKTIDSALISQPCTISMKGKPERGQVAASCGSHVGLAVPNGKTQPNVCKLVKIIEWLSNLDSQFKAEMKKLCSSCVFSPQLRFDALPEGSCQLVAGYVFFSPSALRRASQEGSCKLVADTQSGSDSLAFLRLSSCSFRLGKTHDSILCWLLVWVRQRCDQRWQAGHPFQQKKLLCAQLDSRHRAWVRRSDLPRNHN